MFLISAKRAGCICGAQTRDGGLPEEIQCQEKAQGTAPFLMYMVVTDCVLQSFEPFYMCMSVLLLTAGIL